jgi:translation initiation factor 6
MLRLGDIDGNPYIGVYCSASERLAVVAECTIPKTRNEISRSLDVEVLATTVAGSTVVGSLVAMNSNGAVVTNFAEKSELARFPKDLNIGMMEEKLNASGNNILVTDRAALVHPAASNRAVKVLGDVFGVEVGRGSVAGIQTVGSACIATSKGVVCHPKTTEAELRMISELFKVPAVVGTLNYGTPYLGACAIANTKGAYVGSRSTPIELGRLEDGLHLY